MPACWRRTFALAALTGVDHLFISYTEGGIEKRAKIEPRSWLRSASAI
jgi:hypothetical protein